MDTKVVDVPERGCFEVRIGDRVVGLASYHVEGDTMPLPHTEVDPSVGGRGIGTALVAGVLSAARERGLHVLPYCSFVRHYIQQHPEEIDLVADVLHVHLGLYGQFTTGAGVPPAPRGALRMRWEADGPDGLGVWTDLRGATACEVLTRPEVAAILGRLGPDPLRRGADGGLAFRRIATSRTAIGALLMDQAVLAGVGNVYR